MARHQGGSISYTFLRVLTDFLQGTPISADQPISFHYVCLLACLDLGFGTHLTIFLQTRNFRPGQSLIVEDDLIACDDDEAPDSWKSNLFKVCTLTTDLNAVPKGLFSRLTTTKNIEFDNLDFELHMKIESANLVFELRVDGLPYGEVQADFN